MSNTTSETSNSSVAVDIVSPALTQASSENDSNTRRTGITTESRTNAPISEQLRSCFEAVATNYQEQQGILGHLRFIATIGAGTATGAAIAHAVGHPIAYPMYAGAFGGLIVDYALQLGSLCLLPRYRVEEHGPKSPDDVPLPNIDENAT